MAIVYRARDVRLRRGVAIKVLPPELAYRADVRTRFLREAETAAQLSHPNIVPIYSVDERDGLVFFAMGLVVGDSLGELLEKNPRPPLEMVRRVLSEVLDALSYAHSRGVVHRDIKPDNVLIERESGRAMVTDFGIARAAEAESRLTVTGVAVGTPAYMSPEQALGDHELDGRSDIYSLGVVGYEMLAGELPFRAANTPAMLMKHVGEVPRPVRERRLDCPPALARAIDVALAKGREERWPDAAAFRKALESAEVDAPPRSVPSPRASSPQRLPAPPASHDDWRHDQAARREAARDARAMRYAGMSVEQRVRAFRRDAVGAGGTIAFLCVINVVFTPFFPWAVFPAVGYVSRLWKRMEPLENEGITVGDVLSPRWRSRLQAKGKLEGTGSQLPASAPPAYRQVPESRALAQALSTVPADVLAGRYGSIVRRAHEDRAVIVDTMGKLSISDREAIPDVAPTAASLFQRVTELAGSLQRIEGDVSDDAIARLDARIAEAKGAGGDTHERERTIALLERQRATLADLQERRRQLLSQLESASLVLQNLRLDLVKLRSAGIDAAASDLNSATQEARALSRDIGHVLDAADEVRRIGRG
jgi:hypothetical protein